MAKYIYIKDVADYVSPYANLHGILDILDHPACRIDYRVGKGPSQ